MKELSSNTIYDVAARAGVSISTVSRFLNSPHKVNSQTAQRIGDAIEQLAYIPHGNSGAKGQRRVGRIGVLTPFFSAPSFVQRLQGLATVFRAADCEMIVYTVDSPAQLAEYLHSIPFTRRLDGLVVLAMRLEERDIDRLEQAGLQVVVVEQHHPRLSGVEADNHRGGELAAEHFLERGYSPCGFVGERVSPPYSLQPSEVRWQGYHERLARGGQSVRAAHVRLGEGSVADGFRMGVELLSASERPRAVFAMSDVLAIGLLKAAKHTGLRVPDDVAVLGFDDIDAADYLDLSTVSQSLSESGRWAAELLLARIREPGRPLQNVQLNVSVVVRATT